MIWVTYVRYFYSPWNVIVCIENADRRNWTSVSLEAKCIRKPVWTSIVSKCESVELNGSLWKIRLSSWELKFLFDQYLHSIYQSLMERININRDKMNKFYISEYNDACIVTSVSYINNQLFTINYLSTFQF